MPRRASTRRRSRRSRSRAGRSAAGRRATTTSAARARSATRARPPTRAAAAPPRSSGPAERSDGARRGARRGDVAGDLVDQVLLAREGSLVAQALPQLDDEPAPVQVALEVEQERLDPPFVAAVVRVRPDRDGGARVARR